MAIGAGVVAVLLTIPTDVQRVMARDHPCDVPTFLSNIQLRHTPNFYIRQGDAACAWLADQHTTFGLLPGGPAAGSMARQYDEETRADRQVIEAAFRYLCWRTTALQTSWPETGWSDCGGGSD